MSNILMAEDDQSLAATTRHWLTIHSHKVDVAFSGSEALEFLDQFEYDVVILDWDLPGIQGIDILRRLRQKGSQVPILMLTGKDQIEHKELAFEAGTDDYLTKPFHPRELSARLKALLRRPALLQNERLIVRNVALEPAARKVFRDDTEIGLQPLEFDLLEFLMRHPNQIFSVEALMNRVWGTDADVSTEAVYTCIKRMRKKIDLPGSSQTIVRNVFGAGYILEG